MHSLTKRKRPRFAGVFMYTSNWRGHEQNITHQIKTQSNRTKILEFVKKTNSI